MNDENLARSPMLGYWPQSRRSSTRWTLQAPVNFQASRSWGRYATGHDCQGLSEEWFFDALRL